MSPGTDTADLPTPYSPWYSAPVSQLPNRVPASTNLSRLLVALSYPAHLPADFTCCGTAVRRFQRFTTMNVNAVAFVPSPSSSPTEIGVAYLMKQMQSTYGFTDLEVRHVEGPQIVTSKSFWRSCTDSGVEAEYLHFFQIVIIRRFAYACLFAAIRAISGETSMTVSSSLLLTVLVTSCLAQSAFRIQMLCR